MKKINITLMLVFLLVIQISLISAQTNTQQSSVTWCAERTISGAYCQNVAKDQVDENYLSSPTSCESTSFCKRGCCYDGSEGLCAENVPQRACTEDGGIWSDSPNCQIPQCELGCCVLGQEAAFTSLQRCKVLAGDFGLNADFRTNVADEASCIALATSEDIGACVYDFEFTRTCKFTTRGQCKSEVVKADSAGVEFYEGKLCTDEELNTNCQKTKDTTCLDGKDEVYFVDSCGNPGNIYDASKVNDINYWTNVVSKEESCSANPNSRTCGNCDYLGGSICAQANRGANPSYGNYICQDINCYDTENGNDYNNGETWCVFDQNNKDVDSVGSRYFRHTCFMGEETIEACADFRQEVCIESSIGEGGDSFSQAGCVVNRWQDCVLQGEEDDCINTDKRDCTWVDESTKGSQFQNNEDNGKCVPKISPGLQFWDESAKSQCDLASQNCVVKFEKSLLGGKKCVENCECLEEDYEAAANNICTAIGDCGANVNYIGVYSDKGYEIDSDTSDKKPISTRQTASPGGNQVFGGPSQTGTFTGGTGNVIQGWMIKTYNGMKGE